MVKHLPTELLNFDNGVVVPEGESIAAKSAEEIAKEKSAKAKRSRVKSEMKNKIPNSVQKLRKLMDNLRRDNKMQLNLMQREIEKEMGTGDNHWQELLVAATLQASDSTAKKDSEPYLYAAAKNGLGLVINRNHNSSSRKSQKAWIDSTHH